MKTMIRFCGVISALSILSGCSFLLPQDVTQEDKERLVFSAVRASTTLAIIEINKDNKEDQIVVATKIVSLVDNDIIPTLNNPEAPVNKALEQQLLKLIPDRYRALMVVAFEVFNTYYSFPTTGDVLPPDQLALLRAFFSGFREGANDVLVVNGVSVINVPFTMPNEGETNG